MIRLLIADAHRLLGEGLARLLDDQDDFEVVSLAANYADVFATLRDVQIDAAILDQSMVRLNGTDPINYIKTTFPKIRVLVICRNGARTSAVRALRAGADGFITADDSSGDVVAAIRQIIRGARYLCPSVAEKLALSMASSTDVNRPHESLSDREFSVFELLVAGKRVSEIASELSLSLTTVSTHKTHILQKLDLHNTAELVRYAIEHHLEAE